MAVARNNTSLFRWNRHVYMTDLEVMHAPWFREQSKVDYYNYIDSLHGFYTYRWGDHAFRTLQLKIFLNAAQSGGDKPNGGRGWKETDANPPSFGVLQLKEFPYAHQRFCTCGDARLKCSTFVPPPPDGSNAPIRTCEAVNP